MSRHRQHHGSQRIVPSAEAKAAIRQDYPANIRLQLWLLAQGKAHAGKQRCLICGKRGEFGELWIPRAALSIIPGDDAKAKGYWTCRRHHEAPVADEELIRLLAKQR